MKNIAVVGCGYWGKNLVRNFYELNVLVAVCDSVTTVAKKFSEQYSIPAKTLEEVLKDRTIQGVVFSCSCGSVCKVMPRSYKSRKRCLRCETFSSYRGRRIADKKYSKNLLANSFSKTFVAV